MKLKHKCERRFYSQNNKFLARRVCSHSKYSGLRNFLCWFLIFCGSGYLIVKSNIIKTSSLSCFWLRRCLLFKSYFTDHKPAIITSTKIIFPTFLTLPSGCLTPN